MSTQWEYRDFAYEFKPGWTWCRLGSGGYTEAGARLEFWQMSQKDIVPELQKWLDAGWEPLGEIGPSAIAVHTYKSFAKTPGQAAWNLLGAAMTFGFYLLIASNWYAEPREFRVQMRRKVSSPSVPVAPLPPPTPPPAAIPPSTLSGQWLGKTHNLATPSHLWSITQVGSALTIDTAWEGQTGIPARYKGTLAQDGRQFGIMTANGEVRAAILGPSSFVVYKWIGGEHDVSFSRA